MRKPLLLSLATLPPPSRASEQIQQSEDEGRTGSEVKRDDVTLSAILQPAVQVS